MNMKKIVSIIFVLAWMSIVFCFSNQQGESSSNTSSNISKIIIRIIDIQNKYTDLEKEKLIEIVEPVIRKLAHYTLYAMGGIIIANCVYQFCNKEKILIGISTCMGILYAISDELHQLMIAGRSGNIHDVIIDSFGIVTGIMVFLLIIESYKRIVSKKMKNRR